MGARSDSRFAVSFIVYLWMVILLIIIPTRLIMGLHGAGLAGLGNIEGRNWDPPVK